MRPSRQRSLLLLAALLLAAAGLFHTVTSSAPPTEHERIETLSRSLSCPTCSGASVADSQAPLARSIREIISEQVGAGRSDEEVRAWFTERYGESVLMAPPTRGVALAVWVLPVLALGLGLLVLSARPPLGRRGGHRAPAPTSPPAPVRRGPDGEPPADAEPRRGTEVRRRGVGMAGTAAVAVAAATALALPDLRDAVPSPSAAVPSTEAATTSADGDAVITSLRSVVRDSPEDGRGWLKLGRALEERGRLDEAIDAYAEAAESQPTSTLARFLLAFALVRTDRATQAEPLLRQVLEDDPAHAEALLLLGTLQRESGDPEAPRTLRRFLEAAPDHPASPKVRSVLARGQEAAEELP